MDQKKYAPGRMKYTEYGRQRLKELMQEMVKPQERLGVELDRNGVTSEVDQEAWLLETPSYSTEKGELIGPKIVQPPQGKTPHIKLVELGDGAQWPSKPITTTSSKSPGNVVGQSPTNFLQKPTAGRGRTRDDQEEEQFSPRPSPRGNGGGEGGGDGNGGGGGDDEEEEKEEDKDDEDTETATESKNGEKQNAPRGGGGGGDEPSSNPGGGNVGPRGKRGHRGQRG